MEEDGVEAEERERMRGWESKLFILVVIVRLLCWFVGIEVEFGSVVVDL
jgi:hypothetical protein